MEARYQDGAALTHDEITGMLLAAMFAGHHTSSVTTAWALIELCKNPAYMRRVVAELDETYGESGQTDYQSLRNIPVTEHAVKETLRLYPPLFLLIRVVQKDWTFKGHHLPKGTWILVSPTVSQRDREVFTHPYTFDPDRFAEPRNEGKKDWAFIAFGGGRHKCLGNAFALLQVKAILGTLLRRYEFELVDPKVKPDFHGLVIGPSEPCRLRYRRREEKVAARPAPKVEEAPKPAPKKKEERVQLRIALDLDLCQGHAVCVNEAPGVFYVSDETGKVALHTDRPDPSQNDAVRAAADYCPQRVIQVHEEDEAPLTCPVAH